MKTKLCYWSASSLSPNRANTVQTLAMLKAFRLVNPEIVFATPVEGVLLQKLGISTPTVTIPKGSIFSINRILRENGITHLIARAGGAELPLCAMGFIVVSEFHDIPHTFFSKFRLFIFTRFPNFRQLISISQGLSERLILVPKLKKTVLHDGVDGSVIQLPVQSLPQGNCWRFGYAGSFSKGKGLNVILEAAKLVPNAQFEIAGGTREDFAVYFPEFGEIPSNCQFYGRIDHLEIQDFLEKCDVLLLPNSQSNPLNHVTSPLKLFEYMASGRPIISSQTGSLIEVLQESESCIGFQCDNPISLSESIMSLMSNPKHGILVAEQASEKIKFYTWLMRAKKIIELLDLNK